MTSSDPQQEEAKAINVDDQFYTAIAKPFDPQRLLLEIKKLIGEK